MQGKCEIKPNQPRLSRGQSLLEFVLVLPVLLLLILGAMDLGRIFSTKLTLTNAAREGANYLARHPNDAINGYPETVKAATNEAGLPGMVVSSVGCTPKETDFSCKSGGTAAVETTFLFNLLFGNFLNLQPIQLASSVKMLVQ